MGQGVGRDAGEAEVEGGRESVGEGGRERENVVGEERLLSAWTGSRQGKQPPQHAANSARVAFSVARDLLQVGVPPSGGQSLPHCEGTVGRRRLTGGRAAPCGLLPQRRLTSRSWVLASFSQPTGKGVGS